MGGSGKQSNSVEKRGGGKYREREKEMGGEGREERKYKKARQMKDKGKWK